MRSDTQTPQTDTNADTNVDTSSSLSSPLNPDCHSLTIRTLHPDSAAEMQNLISQRFVAESSLDIERMPGQRRHLWIAEIEGKSLAAIAMKEDGLTARIRSVHADPNCRSLPADLLSTALKYCREQGLLKVEVAEELELETTPELLERCGFLYSRSRNGPGRRFVDLYTNIYQQYREPDGGMAGGNLEAGA